MSDRIDGVACVTAQGAAELLGTTQMKILMLLKEKKLTGACRDGAWYVTEASLASYRPEETGRGVPKCGSCSGCGGH